MSPADKIAERIDAFVATDFVKDRRGGRAWCADLCWPDRAPVRFGSVFVRREATMAEVENVLTIEADKHVPAGYRVIDMVPGSLVFMPEAA